VTDARGLDLDAGLTDPRALLGELDDLERLIGLVENSGFHGDLLALPLPMRERAG
jgi:hypothetical protein